MTIAIALLNKKVYRTYMTLSITHAIVVTLLHNQELITSAHHQ